MSHRGQTLQETGDLAQLVSNVSRLVYEASPENRYATFFYAYYDPASRVLTYVNAGHCPPIILRQAGQAKEVFRLKAGGTVVGLFPDSAYKEASIRLERGDLLLAYTDGISEAMNPAEEEWGEERLIQAADRCAGLGAAETMAQLLQDADAFAAGADQHDDTTLVAARVV